MHTKLSNNRIIRHFNPNAMELKLSCKCITTVANKQHANLKNSLTSTTKWYEYYPLQCFSSFLSFESSNCLCHAKPKEKAPRLEMKSFTKYPLHPAKYLLHASYSPVPLMMDSIYIYRFVHSKLFCGFQSSAFLISVYFNSDCIPQFWQLCCSRLCNALFGTFISFP